MLYEAEPEENGERWSDELERGRIVRFASCPFPLPPEEDQDFLRTSLGRYLQGKNISYYPGAGRLVGLRAPSETIDRTRHILRDHSRRVRDFLGRRMQRFTAGFWTGTSSYRPLEEEGRKLGAHASNELVHVDAGAYGATHGDRILRFFVNLHPSRERVWISKGTFAELWRKHGAEAGVPAGGLEPGLAERLYGGALRAAESAFPMLRVIDTSPYDRRMRRFHNWMKDTPSFQDGPAERFAFAPFSAWMVLTDEVSHACLSGQHALVDTFVVPLANCRVHEQVPFRVLSGAAPAR
jgi:hypothetical protein